ncbi:hypothetical protein AAFF_G00399790 [Aldrovandia affinis]|uniref:Gypsy retrotransposon integrase-like protein 1 n=1 Tax=Aldrovandia affinis TaxID=143900 RepID=A0AAD7SCY2_9TELE|nr:hypothetical protein AAFF_G00399790 [Aldrovandia affinis]
MWHGLRKDVRDWVNTCVECQRATVHRHVKVPLETFEVPEKRFNHVNVDLVGPPPASRGFTYLLTTVDRTTRGPEAVPLASTTTADVAQAVMCHGSMPTACLCERFHCSMKAALRASLKDDSWCDWLPWVLPGIRTAPKDDLQSSSAELVYRQPLRMPGGFIPNASVPWSASLQRSTHLSRAEAFVPVPMS